MLQNSISYPVVVTMTSSSGKRRLPKCLPLRRPLPSPKCSCEHVRAGKMPSRAPKKPTIKKLAHEYFVKVNFIDIYGRNIGYDYSFILDANKKKKTPAASPPRRT